MSVLLKILAQKKERLAAAKSSLPLRELRPKASEAPGTLDFAAALQRKGGPIRLIAEIKKASPSKGLIRKDFDHREIASVYEREDVDALSVLTEEDFFQGCLGYLRDVRGISSKPLLRKDFIFDEYQVYEARANLADAVLLIASVLDGGQAAEFLHLAKELGMAVLFEVHDHAELEMALAIDALIIGINNRNLKTLQIDLNTTFSLKREIPTVRTVVSESGIRSREDVLRLEEAGIDAILVGTRLMESPDIGRAIRDLRGGE